MNEWFRLALLLILVNLITNGCASLTHKQVKLTSNYFSSISGFPSHCRLLNEHAATSAFNSQILQSSLSHTDSIKVNLLIGAIDEFEENLNFPDSINESLTMIDGYITSYFALLPDGYDAYHALKSTSQTIGGLFGVGGIVSSIFPRFQLNLKRINKKKVKSHIFRNSSEMDLNLAKVKLYISDVHLPRLDSIDIASRIGFERLFSDLNGQRDPLSFYADHNRILIKYYQRLYQTKKSAELLIVAIDLIIDSGHEVTARIGERKKVKPSLEQITKLINVLQRVKHLEGLPNGADDRR